MGLLKKKNAASCVFYKIKGKRSHDWLMVLFQSLLKYVLTVKKGASD